jgi:hypothetical protein
MNTSAARNTEKSTGTEQYGQFMRRLLRSYGRKAQAGELDTVALEQLVALRAELDAQIAQTVTALRSEEGGAYSWAQIGDALGMTRGAAFNKYGQAGEGARKPGGQVAALR